MSKIEDLLLKIILTCGRKINYSLPYELQFTLQYKMRQEIQSTYVKITH